MTWRRTAASAAAAVLLATPVAAAGGGAPTVPTPFSAVAVVGEAGVDVLHPEFALPAGKELVLPPHVAGGTVPVAVPPTGSREERLAALRRGPLGRPAPDTLYRLLGTRLLLRTGAAPGDLLAADAHGTGTASAAAGRTAGAAPRSAVVVTVGFTNEAWSWVAGQPWIDAASTSVFEPVGGPGAGLCDSAAGIAATRASGRLVFAAAGNGPVDSTALPGGGHPALLRVGGVRQNGMTALPTTEGPASYSARAYDLAESYEGPIAVAGTDEVRSAKGTSGSSPRAAGRVVELVRQARLAVGDAGPGVRSGALVVAKQSLPIRGPLADGRLTAAELQQVVLVASRPALPDAPGRYAAEGYGWFDGRAQKGALDVVLGRADPPARAADDAARTAAVTARAAAVAARGC